VPPCNAIGDDPMSPVVLSCTHISSSLILLEPQYLTKEILSVFSFLEKESFDYQYKGSLILIALFLSLML
jgi:hypothetical protein